MGFKTSIRLALVTTCLLSAGMLTAQLDPYRTASYTTNGYMLASPLAEQSEWFIPDKFLALNAATGQYGPGPGQKVRSLLLSGNYNTKPDWGYTYRPIVTWSGWGGTMGKIWHEKFKENILAPSYYFALRSKMKTFQRPKKRPSKYAFFGRPTIVQYRPRDGAELDANWKFNGGLGAMIMNEKFYAGIQAARLFKSEISVDGTPVIYYGHYNAFFSYHHKWVRPSVIVHFSNKKFTGDVNLEREFDLEKLVKKPLNVFVLAHYSYFTESWAGVVGVKRLWGRFDSFFKFQKVYHSNNGKVKPLFELTARWAFGPIELERTDNPYQD